MSDPTPTPEPCIDCGTTTDVEFTECPYASEINFDHTKYWMCQHCQNERAMDI